MRDRDRDLWSVGGTFLSRTEVPLAGLQSISIQKLDALIYNPDKRSWEKEHEGGGGDGDPNVGCLKSESSLQSKSITIGAIEPDSENAIRTSREMTADELKGESSGDDENRETVVANILGEICGKVPGEEGKRPILQRSFSCDYGTEYGKRGCFIDGCACDLKKRSYEYAEAYNFGAKGADEERKRRNSVQFASYEDIFGANEIDTRSFEFVDADDFKEEETKSNRDSLYSLEEHDEELDENENLKKAEEDEKKQKSGGFLKSIFNRKPKQADDPDVSLKRKGRKYSSAIDISTKPLKRSSSFLKKKLNNIIHSEGAVFLRRSLSFRTLDKGEVVKSREKLCEIKNQEWRQSLQSLLENDVSVSYADFSFVNYDRFNSYSYTEGENLKKKDTKIWRTQSMLVNGSLEARRTPKLTRGTSIAGVSFQLDERPHVEHKRNHSSTFDISVQSGAVSLPSLHHLNRGNVDCSPDSSPTHRYRRRPQSVNSDDYTSDSFRSAGSGCAKLKRTNACRQKSRTAASSPPKSLQDDTVRSRSLNHLDTLEMRQGAPPPSDAALKDARSEPDCTRPLLAPPGAAAAPSESTSPSKPEPRRHMLSRSQKSSSECFSVNFEVGDESTYDTELFFPATRGVTLNDSLSKLCELRNIDLTCCDAWLSDRDGNTQSWLSLSQDTACLVGKHVRIAHKDASARAKLGSLSGSHSRKLSGNFRPKQGFFSSSTEEASSISWQQDTKSSVQDFVYKKQTKQRWSGLFGNSKDTKQSMDQLIEQLNNYSKSGVPSNQSLQHGQCDSIDALYKLEDDWKDLMDVSELSEKQQKQQTALWELIKTEVAYIKTLKVVTDLFLACLLNLQTSNILKEIDTGKLFSNINDILDANVQFWRNSLFPMVRDMRRYRQPPCIESMCEGFLKIREGFTAYHRFCGEQSRCQHYCRENFENDLFAAYLAWCETQKECNRLRLMDILVQPMQRLTKYGLLLKAILKNTDDEVDRDNLACMIRSVDDFVNNVNSSLKQKQDNERLKGIIARIESYDIVETKDDDLEKLLRSYNQLDLNKPMLNCPPERKRHLLLEGDLKLKDSSTSKVEVHCFLLTDMLLVCKSSTKKGGATMRVIRQPYLVDRLIVHEIHKETPTLACIYKNEFDMAVAAFLLQNNDSKKLKSWKEGIIKAQNLYSQAKQSNLAEESLDAEYSFEYPLENEYHCLQLAPRSPLASSSRASRVSSLAHSHSGSVEMNDQSSIGSAKDASRAVSMENENRTASISSDEGVQPLPPDKSPVSQKNSFKHPRLFHKTPNTLSVQPYTHNLGQSLPNLVLGSPNTGTLSLNLPQNTLSVPGSSKNGHLLSPTHRGISYPPPSPTRGNLRRGLAINQTKNPPLIKTRHVNSTGSSNTAGPVPASFDFDVPVIAASSAEHCENFCRGQHRQAMMKRFNRNDNKRYHTAGTVDDIKKNDAKDSSIHKRLSWNCSSANSDQSQPPLHPEDQT